MKKFALYVFFILVCLSLLAPLFVFKDLLFPYVTSKALYFRICIEAALPFYIYLLIARPDLRPKWRKAPLNWLMLVFLLLNLVSALTGVSLIRSLWGNFERMGGVFYLATLTSLYFYVLMIGQMGGSFLKRFLQFFLGVALLVTINGFFGKLGWPTFVSDPSLSVVPGSTLLAGRVSSTLGNPIYLGSFLVIPLFVAAFLAAQAEEKFKKWAYYFFGFLFLVGIFLSGTRGALVGLVAGVFLAGVTYVALTPNRRLRMFGLLAVAAFAIIAGFLFTYSSHLPEGSVVRRIFTLKDSNTEARLIQWGVALKGYKERPLFGIGPENYYYIGNKYYNPAIFNFDRSWFDKPHNYPLEILVTDGAAGFIVYVTILLLMVGALYRGYKRGFLSLFEFSLLTAALLVYEIQNLTVFDTVPASLTFYTLLGFCGFIWQVALEDKVKNNLAAKKSRPGGNASSLSAAVFSVAGVVTAYLIYSTGIIPLEIAKAVNYGYAYGQVNPQTDQNFIKDITTSYNFYQRAVNLPFNFDKTESFSKYADTAVSLARSTNPEAQDLTKKFLSDSITALNEALGVEPNYPILWMNLSQVYIFQAAQNGQLPNVDPRAEQAVKKAIELTPNREEAYISLAQLKAVEGQWSESEAVLKDLQKRMPQDKSLVLQLANIYRNENKTPEAVKAIEDAQNNGFVFSSYSEMKWVIDYYISQKSNESYVKAYLLVAEAQKLEPNNIEVFISLAKLEFLMGQKDQAVALANQIVAADSTRKAELQPIFDYQASIKK